MMLFNPKTISRNVGPVQPVPEPHRRLLEEWAEMVRSGRILREKETALHGSFKANIVEAVLGYTGVVTSAEHTVTAEKAILGGSVDLALGHFGPTKSQIIAPFELKGAKTKDLDAIMPGRAKSPVQQAWEYATKAPGVKWVLVSNYVELRLYGFGEGTSSYEKFEFARLTEPAEYARFMLLLSADNLLSGRTLALLAESRKEDKDITNELYRDYKALRSSLIAAVQKAAPSVHPLDAISAAQTILDRVLFTAFAEDTGLLPKRILEKAFENADPFNPRPVWDNFKGLFAAIDKGNARLDVPPYNGGLFAPDPIVDGITIPDEVCEGFKKIGDYDFASQVSVTVLGHIFEQSIADVERLQAEARGEEVEEAKSSGTSGRRKRDGVVYTPDYIARFIVQQTLGAHLKDIFAEVLAVYAKKGATADDEEIQWKRKGAELEAWEAYRDRLKTLRIVDPACGSGVFLVLAFDFMKAELTRVNEKIADLKGGALGLFDPDSEILTNNLFGVDVNAESVEIAKLSLWVKTARRGKMLDSLDDNLKVGDSLIEDSSFAYLEHGFSWRTAFPEVFADGGFDVVLGNPPYVRMELLKAMKPYLETRFEVVSDRADLYCYFFERGLKLLKPGGRLGYISSSTFFKTGSGRPLRNFLRAQATLETVVDFGDLQVFEGVTTYPAILTMRREEPAKTHALRFWKVEDLPETNFTVTFDKKAEAYPQAALSADSWELENAALKALRDKIRKGKRTLKEVYGSPLYGIKTGLNDAFVIDSATKERLCAQDPKSADLLKPFLEGKDLKRWRAEPRGLWIIYIPKNRINIEDYPAIRDWLLPFKDQLEKRATKQEWFELQQAQEAYAEPFSKPKISYPHFSQGRKFSYDETGFFSNDKTYFHPSGHWDLLALLNSTVIWFYLRSICSAMRGGEWRLELRVQYVETIPIPSIMPAQKAELSVLAQASQKAAEARYRLQHALTRRIPDLAPAGTEAKLSTKLTEWWDMPDFSAFRAEVKKVFKADIPLAERTAWEDWIRRDKTEIARLSVEIKENEDRINTLVYELFELTADEIKLLEESV
ncbi:DNA methyltransferase [Rhizobium sp. SSA_523]|uniref:Eco57I restriction-modification methylase domain-containing protein n=1 Tax=Rhizobium sp. SSA_523 TaxID=2952477 RepID=UPI002090BD10|nr:DNA methyltransferase [Rhizobium sp. SSA_523]MCO5734422.1 N-6 DNA methylase [Rhizobium sp. SSA_523]WKC21129.1 TaqI-like C-terminal specificity domain-containing protein [Rhizobium sp. SSA_523]